MLKFLEQGYLTNGSRRDSLIFRLETNFLQSIDLVRVCIARLVDNTVGALTDHLNLLVLINLGLHSL